MADQPETATDQLLRRIAMIPRAEIWKGSMRCIACGTHSLPNPANESHAPGCWSVDLHFAAEKVRREREIQKKQEGHSR